MTTFAAANILENPATLLVLIMFSALSSWLMKRRHQRGTDSSPNAGAMPLTPGQQERSARQFDWQGAIRQLLEGEAPPQAPPPLPFSHADPDGQTSKVWPVKEQFHTKRFWMEEALEHDEESKQEGNMVTEQSGQHNALQQARTSRIEAHMPLEKVARHVPSLLEKATHPARTASTAHRQHSNGQTVRYWRDPWTVRQAFISSLVFAPPKGLET